MPRCLGPCHTPHIPSEHTVVLYLRCYLKSDMLTFEVMQASKEGQLKVACMLIERGTGVSAQDKDSQTPLHQASEEGELEVACMLIERGAGVSAQDKDGQTLLHQASEEGELEVACMLVECGANVSDHWPAHLTCI
jgi:ankyrin repeat protein